MYNILGDKIANIANENVKEGASSYIFNGDQLAPGVFVCKLIVESGGKKQTIIRKLVKY